MTSTVHGKAEPNMNGSIRNNNFEKANTGRDMSTKSTGQTIPILKRTSTPGEYQAAIPAQEEGNRQRLLTVGLPIAAIAAFCLFSYAQRTVNNLLNGKSHGTTRNAAMNQATDIANGLCLQLTGQGAESDMQFSEQTAFSKRRNKVVREWDVICNASNGEQYLLRINSQTHRVYAVNHMDTKPTELAIARPAQTQETVGRITAEEAEMRIRQYLKLIDVDSANLEPVAPYGEKQPANEDEIEEREWDNVSTSQPLHCFTYRHHVPGIGDRLIKVAINSRTGDLEHIWNPAAAL